LGGEQAKGGIQERKEKSKQKEVLSLSVQKNVREEADEETGARGLDRRKKKDFWFFFRDDR